MDAAFPYVVGTFGVVYEVKPDEPTAPIASFDFAFMVVPLSNNKLKLSSKSALV